MKKLITVILTFTLVLGALSSALACTGIVVGKNVTDNGSLIVARNEDIMTAYNKTFFVNPATSGEGTTTVIDEINGFTWEVPATGMSWTMANDVPEHGDGLYAEMCLNSAGVLISASFAQRINDDILAIDPFTADGLRQAYLPNTVAPFATTAKEAIQMLAKVIAEKGNAESHIILVADADEAWVMELLSGHQWTAAKVPDDKFIIVANAHILGYIDENDPENYMFSEGLFSMPEEAGLMKSYNGLPHVALTYGKGMNDSSRPRYWAGQNKFSDSQNIAYDTEVFQDFLTPDAPISLYDVMTLLGYRYEGTEHDANVTGERAIGSDSTVESHIFEYKTNGIVTGWLCLGSVEDNVFLPFYPALSETPASYQIEGVEYNANSAYWTFKGMTTRAHISREHIAPAVKAFWAGYQQQLIAKMNASDKDYLAMDAKAQEAYANEMFAEIAADAMEKADKISDEMMYYLALNSSMTKTPDSPFTISFQPDDE